MKQFFPFLVSIGISVWAFYGSDVANNDPASRVDYRNEEAKADPALRPPLKQKVVDPTSTNLVQEPETQVNWLAAPKTVAISATKTVVVSGGGAAVPGAQLDYSVVITNSGSTDATGVVFTDVLSSNLTLMSNTVLPTIIAGDDNYTCIGNVGITVGVATGALDPDGVLANDVNPSNASVQATAFNTTGTQGTVQMNPNGSFTFTPNAGFSGTTTFGYTVAGPPSRGTTGTVTITVTEPLWFVNIGASSNGTGTLANPFKDWSDFATANNTANGPAANEVIFVYSGTYSGTATLLSGQKVLGRGATTTLASFAGISLPTYSKALPTTSGTRPNLTSSGTTITLGSGNSLRGFDMGNSVKDISGSSFGTLTASEITLNANGAALDLSTGTLAATFTSIVSTDAASDAISLTSVSGTLTSAGGTTITNPAGYGILMGNNSVTSNFGNTSITGSSNTSVGVIITGDCATTFGDLDISPDAGGMAINTTNNAGAFTCTSGTITTTNASAIVMGGSSSASKLNLNMALTSVSADEGANAIKLINTSGSFTVTGSGSVAGSGGVVQNVTDHAIELTNASNVSLNYMNISNTIVSCYSATNLSGTCAINNCSFSMGGGASSATLYNRRNVHILNKDVALTFNVNGSTFNGNLTNSPSDNHGIAFETDATSNSSTVTTLNIKTSTFNKFNNYPLYVTSSGVATTDVGFQNSSIDYDPGNGAYVGGAIHLWALRSGSIKFNILNNTSLKTSGGLPVDIYANNFDGGTDYSIPTRALEGRMTGNTLNRKSTDVGTGVNLLVKGKNKGVVQISNNTIVNGNLTVQVAENTSEATNENARLDATITGNTVEELGSNYGIDILSGAASTTNFSSIINCVKVSSNTISPLDGSGLGLVRFFTNGVTDGDGHNVIWLEGANGTSETNLVNYWNNNSNSPTGVTTAGNTRIRDAGFGGTGNKIFKVSGTCLTPTNGAPARIAVQETAIVPEEKQEENVGLNPKEEELIVEQPKEEGNFKQVENSPTEVTVVNSVTSTTSALAGETITINGTGSGFTIPAGKSTLITFSATIIAVPVGCTISNQGTVSGSNFANVLTDDPAVSGSANPTEVTLATFNIGNLVYNDVNRNSTFDAGDAGINGVVLRLYTDDGDNTLDAGDTFTGTTATTSGGGVYSFTVCPGVYIVEIAPSNFQIGGVLYNAGAPYVSSPSTGPPDPDNSSVNNDDNGNPVSGFGVATSAFTVTANRNDVDFGFKVPTNITISDVSKAEGDGGATTTYTFNVTRSDNLEVVSLTANTSAGTATSGSDFTAISNQTVSFFAGGGYTTTIQVTVNNDNIVEANETFNVVLSGAPSGAVITDDTGIGTITNDDAATVTLTGGTSKNEGNSGSTSYTFTATLNNPVQDGLSVAYTTSDGTATTGDGDYTNNDGSLSFTGTSGETKTITVLVNGDTKVETDETFTVALGAITSAPSGVTVGGTSQTGTIINDDATTVNLTGGTSKSEGNSGTTSYTFTATLNNAVQGGLSVAYTTSDGTATTADGDYADNDGSLSFTGTSGETKTITVSVNGDTKVEVTETFTVALGAITGASSVAVGGAPQTGTITNDDAATVTLTGGIAKSEGNSGTTSYTFTATLNNAVQGGLSVAYTTSDGTATTADGDYADNDGSLSFTGTASETNTITVLVNGDTKVEANETFTVALGAISGTILGSSISLVGTPQTGTITNDEIDFGDAPTAAQSGFANSYPTTLAENGARHNTTLGFQLGAAIDGENDGQPNATAAGDGSDDDGVTLPGVLVAGTNASVTVNASQAGKLEAWVDFNLDGDWNDVGEQVFTNQVLTSGNNSLSFAVPGGATSGASFARFRLSSAGGLSPTGLSSDGEVEDYQVLIGDVQFSVNDPVVLEGNTGTSNLTFRVSRSSTLNTASVDYTITAGTATAGTDYAILSSGTLNFGAGGVANQDVVVQVNGDLIVEADETLTLTLSNAIGGGISDATGTGTITNDDAATVTLTGGIAKSEGNSGSTSYTFTATLNNAVQGGLSVAYTTSDGTTTIGDGDYTDNDGSLTFTGTSGETKTITVLVNGDTKVEADETFTVALGAITGAPSGVMVGGSSQTGTITNDDAATVTLTGSTSKNESNSGTTSYTFTATLNNPVQGGLSVAYTTSDGTATTGDGDYADNDGSLSFTGTSGETKTITVLVNGDTKVEADETFTVALGAITSAPSGVTVGGSSQTGTITNDDAATVTLTGGTSKNEGNSGSTSYTFTATLNNAVQGGLSVAYTTSDGTATTADGDYTDNDGSLSFTGTSGETKTITVLVSGDTKVEADETFTVALGAITSAPSGVTLGGISQTGTIANDDAATVTLTGGTSKSEGNSGTTSYTFTATLNNAVQGGLSVSYTTSDGTATTADGDYADNDNSLSFTGTSGETKTITVLVSGDTKVEADETFTVALGAITSAPSGVTVGGTSQTGTITNDDAATVTLTGGTSKSEGNSGTTSYTFTATLNNPVQGGLSVAYTTSDGTATTADGDYADNNNSLSFTGTSGETKTITVLVSGDTKVEADETFTVALGAITSAPSGVTVGGTSQTGTITNDDAATVTLTGGTSKSEGNSGSTSYTFTATLNNPVQGGLSVAYTTSDGTATTADGDYTDNDGSLSFTGTSGEIKTITVLVNGDNKVEPDETFTVALGSITGAPSGVTVGGTSQTGTITNDDAATVTLTGGTSKNEGNSGSTSYTFTATLNNPVQGGLSVAYITSDGTATTADGDYADNDGSLSFTGIASETNTITVLVNGDTKVEANETFTVALGAISGTILGSSISLVGTPQTGTITNDEIDFGDAPTAAQSGFANSYPTTLADNGARHNTTLGFQLGAAIDGENDGQPSATAAGDGSDDDGVTLPGVLVAGTNASVTVNASLAGKLDAWVDFNLDGDWDDVGEQIFTNQVLTSGNNSLNFAVPGGATSGTSFTRFRLSSAGGLSPTGLSSDGEVEDYQVVIGDVQFSVNDPVVLEGNTGTSNLTFRVSRSSTLNTASVDYTITAGTATAGTDYAILAAGTLNFSAGGVANQDVVVQVNGDLIVESDETFTLTLSNAIGGGISDATGTGTITNDDAATVTLTGGTSKSEGNSGTTSYTFTATLNNAVQGGLSVAYTTSDGTATTGDGDYTDNDNSLSFTGTSSETKTITVLVNGDTKVETDETFTVALGAITSAPSGVSVGGSSQTGTITNDDAATVTLTGGIAKSEGNSGTTSYTFTATLNNPVQGGLSVAYTTSDGTATTLDGDYTDNDNSLIFTGTSGETKTITVLVNGDTKVETDETFTVALGAITGAPSGVTVGGSSQTGTITNDDAATVTLTGGIAKSEGNSGTTSYTFTATLNNAVQGGLSVAYTTSDGTATTTDGDYADNDGSLSFTGTSGETKTITVLVSGDTKVEADETFTVALGAITGAPSGVTLGGISQTGTIANDDAATVTLTGGIAKSEGNSGTTSYTFTATLNNAVQGGLSVAYTTSDGSATTTDGDYTDNDNSLIFTGTSGETKTITVLVSGDTKVEADETFTVALGAITSAPSGVTVGGTSQTGTITNDDAATVTLTGGTSKSEGNSGTTSYTFTATLNNAVQGGLSVAYTTSDGTATTADGDYADNDGSLSFAGTSGETKTITVSVNGDTKVEADETFTVALGAISGVPSGVTVGGSSQTGTITNDDAATVTLTGGTSKNEGNSGTTSYTFTATLNNAVEGGLSVAYTTSDGTATTADGDYTDNDGSLSFTGTSGETKTITVLVSGDTKIEADETFTVALGAITGTTLGSSISLLGTPQTGTITNDEIDFGDALDTYGTLLTSNGARHTTTLGLQLGAAIDGDTDGQPTANASGEGTDDDGVTLPAVLITNTTANITVNASMAGKLDAWVDFDGNGSFAEAGEQIFASQTLNAGNNNLSFAVPTGATPSSTFARFRLSTVGGLAFNGLANDGEVEDYPIQIVNTLFSVNDFSVAEGNSGTTNLTFTVSRSTNASASSVNYAITDGTAITTDNDYTVLASGTLTFAASGALTQDVTVQVKGDTKVELNENIQITLSSPVNGTISDGSGVGTITNDDAAVISISNPSVTEGSTGTTTLTYTLSMSNPSDADVMVNYATQNGTATTGDNDFQSTTGSHTFTAGQTSKTVNVTVNGDCTTESDETVVLRLSSLNNNGRNINLSGSGATLDGTGTIQNDDEALVISSVVLTQPDCATPTGTIVVTAAGSGTLEYSIDGGANWSTNSTFTGVAPSSTHVLQVRSQLSPTCVTSYGSNPLIINAIPSNLTTFDIGGGGYYCQGDAGLVITLSGSETGVNYQLQLTVGANTINIGASVAGTGGVLSFGLQKTVGTYTVVASNLTTSCTAAMIGSAFIRYSTKPVVSLSVFQENLPEGSDQVLCDIDANPVNNLQFAVSTNCVAGNLVWRSQVGNGIWSDWSTSSPTTQLSNNQPHRYQAACDAACASTYTTPIVLTLNYRASTPQNVSLTADGITVAAGEERTVCNVVGDVITFNATCATGETVLYSVDGAVYLSTIPVQIVDNAFHNYRVRCRKENGTESCVESESAPMSLRIMTTPLAPLVSINPTSSCGTPANFTGTTTCGALATVWYNATTHQALPNLPTTTPLVNTSYYARCQNSEGCLGPISNVVSFTITPVSEAPVVTASNDVVCTGVSVTLSANCPTGAGVLWNNGTLQNTLSVSFNSVIQQAFTARCVFGDGCQSPVSAPKTVLWKAFDLTLINIGEPRSGIKTTPNPTKADWSGQFVTPDAGPTLDNSTESNPTLFYTENVNKTGPRYWTINVETCALGTDGSLTFDMLATPETGIIRSFNTHENNAPYFMYANRAGYTELYAQNHPAYGFYLDNGVGGNVYDEGLPKGLYKLGIRYWDQKGWGSIYPSTRQPQGNVLAYQEFWFRIQSKDGIGVGAARVASKNGQRITDNGLFAEVMPNPISSVLRLKVTEAKAQKVNISLIDASGRILIQRAFVPETNAHQEEFEVSEIANGMYFLKVSTADKQATLKVVKVQ